MGSEILFESFGVLSIAGGGGGHSFVIEICLFIFCRLAMERGA